MSVAREDLSKSSKRNNLKRFSEGLSKFTRAASIEMKRNYQLYLMVLPAVLLIFIFRYIPMYGVQIAFKDFVPTKGIMGSEWVGFKHFIRFFNAYNFWDILKNTLGLSIYQLIVGFPFPIILALVLNQIKFNPFKKLVQTITYIPHFVSVVVVIGMLTLFTSPDKGIIAHLFEFVGLNPINFMGEAKWFKSIYVFTGIWQSAGWGSIIYLAALAGIDQSLYEAASIDGASKWQKILYIDIPSIVPTAIILLLLNTGKLMSIGFEKVYLMQNPLNQTTSEIISTYVYKMGLLNSQYSYSAAVGLFNTMVNFVLLITLNRLAKKANQTSLW